jgi:glycosyltransferase involved in cell wall biosynthesis
MIAEPPIVSVLLPSYNAAAYLAEAISSALSQNFADLEVLVLDNASTDDSPAVVASFSDSRLRYIRNKVNLGYAGNVELGRSLARGKYAVVLNADDAWEPTYLQNTVALLDAQPGVVFVHTSITLIDEAGAPFGENVTGWDRLTNGRDAFAKCFIAGFSSPTMLMRNDVLQTIPPLPTGEPWAKVADCWLFLQLCLRGDVGFINQRLMRYRVHSSSLMFESYLDGTFFSRRLATVREAFAWSECRSWANPSQRRMVTNAVARAMIAILPAARAGRGRWVFVRAFTQIAREAPVVLLYPASWARLMYGLLPWLVIQRLRARKRNRWAVRHANPQDTPVRI